ncbi:protein containing Glycosyl hydrolase 67, partial [mine drainage metagenome]
AWTYRLRTGRTVWDSLLRHYQRGLDTVARMRKTWAGLARYVDPQRFRLTADFLTIQQHNAQWWRDASIAYWESISHLPLPPAIAPSPFPLKAYEAFCIPYVAGTPGGKPPCAPDDGPVPY